MEFSLTLYRDQASLNVPASTQGREFIARLTAILGPPVLEPTIKCSCSWGDGVMGAMLIVLWNLPADPASPVLPNRQPAAPTAPSSWQPVDLIISRKGGVETRPSGTKAYKHPRV